MEKFNAVSFFWNSADLLQCLADQVTSTYGRAEVCSDVQRRNLVDKFDLSALCLVNRACRLAFTPQLYRHIYIFNRYPPEGANQHRHNARSQMSVLAQNPNAVYIRTLTVGRCRTWELEEHEALRLLLRRLSSLRSFDVAGVPLEASTVATLVSSCRSLSSVHIDLSASMHTIFARHHLGGVDLTRQYRNVGLEVHLGDLAHLQELCLDHLYGDPEQWIEPIARILHASPGLQKLQLSISQKAVLDHLSIHGPDLSFVKTFLLGICTAYKARGAAPLRLRSFRCGSGVHPNFPSTSDVAFTDLSSLDDLEVVYLNTSIGVPASFSSDTYIAGTDRDIPITTFLYDTPRLRCFTVSRYDTLVHRALSSPLFNPDRARQLAVTWDVLPKTTMLGPTTLVRIGASPRHHFRMFKIDFRPFAAHERAQNEAHLDARGILEGLIDGDDGTLEGLEVQFHMKGWELYIDLLVEMMPRLTGLTQLLVRLEESASEYSDPRFSYRDAARRLAVVVKRLKYVGIGTIGMSFWEVVRGQKGAVPTVTLVDMPLMEEVEAVELFGMRKRTPGYVFADRGSI
ncbi:hypothetical protein QBC39DRAFT_351528 [Podospora conica]|nr:hypothetical protein QBC39DRAFT_351528 [Schizothecium conicum]